MEEIKVGEYIRTISGNIDKVDALYGMIENTIHLEKHKWQDIKNIVKHSPAIIDLIEEGDLIRIKIQFHHKLEPYFDLVEIEDKNSCNWKHISEQLDLCHYEIIEIYTKEMMESIKYEV